MAGSSDGPAGHSTYDTAMLQQNGGAAGTWTAWATAITAVVAVAGVAVAFAVLRIEQARRRDEQADRAERHDQQRRAQLRVQWHAGSSTSPTAALPTPTT